MPGPSRLSRDIFVSQPCASKTLQGAHWTAHGLETAFPRRHDVAVTPHLREAVRATPQGAASTERQRGGTCLPPELRIASAASLWPRAHMASLIPLELELEFYSGSGEYIAGEERGDSLPIAHSTAHRHGSRVARRKLARHSTQGLEMNAQITQCAVVEWKKTLGEVKREYNNRKYQLCSARCRELLDRAKNTVSQLVKTRQA